ncbi:BlaI/MecI/CopY family transcriptional regulator [Anaerolentibacter hominis]|uniref:BlaI/MecI/CopY family transcriptional regulator n=1 Tax=Anaerolentibacter hominis TaxID=3079009 RepID=UPI0031B820BE
MEEYKLGVMETRFAELIWEREPVASGELIKLCAEEFGWKKSTAYTMLRRLCERGIFKNEESTVSALLSREEFLGKQSEEFVEETFGGSLPRFLSAFTRQRKLSDGEIEELRKLIEQSGR